MTRTADLLHLALLFGAICLVGCAAVPLQDEQNCRLTAPPADAVRTTWEGSDVYVFPAQAGPAYSGCGWMWIMREPGRPYMESTLKFLNGELIHYRSKQTHSSGREVVTECTYQSGRAVAQKTEPTGERGFCPDATRMHSMLTEPVLPGEVFQ